MTAAAKILKTATETPKELIKLIKIIKTQVLPGKCLSGSWGDALGGERGRSRGCTWSQKMLLGSWKHRPGARRRARVTPPVPACVSSQRAPATGLAWYSTRMATTGSRLYLALILLPSTHPPAVLRGKPHTNTTRAHEDADTWPRLPQPHQLQSLPSLQEHLHWSGTRAASPKKIQSKWLTAHFRLSQCCTYGLLQQRSSAGQSGGANACASRMRETHKG